MGKTDKREFETEAINLKKISIINKTIVIDVWRVSNSDDMVLVRAYKSVTGWLQEMESTKQFVEFVARVYSLWMTIFDLVSAASHYYKGRVRLDHTLVVLDNIFEALHPIFKVIKERELSRGINALLKSFACHNGLRRLD